MDSEAKEVKISGVDNLSTKTNGYLRDLLNRPKEGNRNSPIEIASGSEETELNLELSLGVEFGVDVKQSNLIRSSSMAFNGSNPVPMETKEEWKKQLECGMRIEAKRKRSLEEQSHFRAMKDRVSLEGNREEDNRREAEGLVSINSMRGINRLWESGTFPYGLPYWAPRHRDGSLSRCVEAWLNEKGNINLDGVGVALRRFPPLMSQGSLGSQGSGSCVISEFESELPNQGLSNCTEMRIPEQIKQKAIISSRSSFIDESGMSTKVEVENQLSQPKVINTCVSEIGRKVMEEVPCVFTVGDGPNGRKVEGFLYKYKKGEGVCIVCMCHGSFFSPTEFVKHAGGSEVALAHPLRYIVVKPSSSF